MSGVATLNTSIQYLSCQTINQMLIVTLYDRCSTISAESINKP